VASALIMAAYWTAAPPRMCSSMLSADGSLVRSSDELPPRVRAGDCGGAAYAEAEAVPVVADYRQDVEDGPPASTNS